MSGVVGASEWPQWPHPKDSVVLTFADLDDSVIDSLEVARSDNEVSFLVRGKRGRAKATLWISREDAAELARFITDGCEANPVPFNNNNNEGSDGTFVDDGGESSTDE